MTGAVRYEIRHVSRYRYTSRVRRCVMLLCLEPREDRGQRLLRFEIETRPAGGLTRETDCFGNARHVLDVHHGHRVLEITTRATVDWKPPVALPTGLGAGAWRAIRALEGSFADWDFMHPSPLIRPSPALAAFVERHRIEPGSDPRVHARSVGYRTAAGGATTLRSFGSAGAAFETDATAEGSLSECASSVRCASGEQFPPPTPSTDRAVAGSRPTLPWIPDGAILLGIQPRSSSAQTTTPTRTRGRWIFRPNAKTEP